MKAYAYIYVDPTKTCKIFTNRLTLLYEPFYVGKGTGNRHNWLLEANHPDLNRILKHKMQSLSKLKITPECMIIECDSEIEAFQLEDELTHQIGLLIEKLGPLRNARHGGIGGFALSNDTKKILSDLNSGNHNPNFGKKWTDERKAKFKETLQKSIASGKIVYSHERMQALRSKHLKTYKITFPTGEEVIVTNLTKWCKETNNPLSSLRIALKNGGTVMSECARGYIGSGSKPSKLDGVKIEYIILL